MGVRSAAAAPVTMRILHAILCWLMAAVLPATASSQTLLDPPQLLGNLAMPDEAYECVVLDHYVLVTNYAAGLAVVDVADPAHPTAVGGYDTPGLSIQCALGGSRAFVGDHTDGGLQILSMSAPAYPAYAGSYVTGDAAVMAAWRDGLLLVGYIEGRVDVLDVSTPSQPVLLSSFPTTGAARAAVFSGPYAFVADYGYGLRVVDLADSSAPVQVGAIAAINPLGLDLAGSTVYLACANGLRTIDVADPTAPRALDRVQLPGPAVTVKRAGHYALVAAHVAGGLQVVDVADPADITVATSYVTGKYSYGVATAGDYAYLADGYTFKVFRVFDGSVPVEKKSFGRLKAGYRGN